MNLVSRPRRSCLFMPANNPRAVAKARTLPADMIVLDLEDAVAPDAKAAAREQAVDELAQGGFGESEILVRVNALETLWGPEDIGAIAGGVAGNSLHCDGIVLPKVESAEVVEVLNQALDDLGVPDEIPLWIMVETPFAVLNIMAIADCAEESRLAGFIIGTNDLVKEMRAGLGQERLAVLPALTQTVMAARSYDLAVLDGVYNDYRDAKGLSAECAQGALLGFDGKSCIHPAQLETVNAAFGPSAAALAEAEAIVAAFSDPANAEKGVIAVGGRMVELLHLAEAERLLAMQAQIGERDDHD